MIRIFKPLLLTIAAGAIVLPQTVLAQNATNAAPAADRGSAYYQYTLAHLYANLAIENPGNTTYVNQAVAAYKAAIAADPRSAILAEELSEVYIQFNLLREARTEATAAIAKNPNDLAAHRLLARIYLRQLDAGQNGRVDTNALSAAIDEYKKVTQLDSRDSDSWTMLGRLQRAAQDGAGAKNSFQKALDVDPDNEDALVGLASVLLDNNDVTNASDLLRRAAEKNPSATSWVRLAGTYEQMRDYRLAAETLKKALSYNPPNAQDLRRALAEDLLNSGQADEALETFEALASEDGEDVQALLRISQIYSQKGNFAKAREASDKASKIDPNNIEIRFNDVSILQAEGKPKEAITVLAQILKSTEQKSYSSQQRASRILLMERLALMYRMTEETEQAVAIYRDIADLDSAAGSRVSAEIIDTYRAGKKFTEAQNEANLAVKRYANDRGIRVAKASLDADLGRADAAAADIRKLLDGTDDRGVQLMLAEIYEKGKKFADARQALDAAEKLSQEQDEKVGVWFMRGALYEKMKNLPSAETEFRKVLAVVPDHAPALNYLGYMLTDRNVRLNEALALIQKALAKEPNNGAYLDSLGWAYFRLGRFAEAEKEIGRAVQLSPGDPTMNDHYADALVGQAKYREAIAVWETALKQWEASAPADKDAAEISKVRAKMEQAKTRLAREGR